MTSPFRKASAFAAAVTSLLLAGNALSAAEALCYSQALAVRFIGIICQRRAALPLHFLKEAFGFVLAWENEDSLCLDLQKASKRIQGDYGRGALGGAVENDV